MTTKKEQNNMIEFVDSMLGKNYKTQRQQDGIEATDDEKNYFVYCIGVKPTERIFNETINKKINENKHIAVIFYKNNKDFHVRLAESAHYRLDKSLKNYTKDERDKMIELRLLEKIVLEKTTDLPEEYSDSLTYYQPLTERLNESIRTYNMEIIEFDYSHLNEYDNGYNFAREGQSINYRIAKHKPDLRITEKAKLVTFPQRKITRIIPE